MPPIVKKILVRGFLGLLGTAVVAYVLDAIQVRIRLATGGPSRAYDTVTVLYAAGLKGGKYEIYSDQPDSETCTRSLFPQLGYQPCWYLRRQSMKMLD
ncbi:MAG TPA: hypothetical protein VMB47_07550 [Candidatus Aquilonibacter sp.]|nr:hypothetical protein [Candidatus Aquilonibacter sp.]